MLQREFAPSWTTLRRRTRPDGAFAATRKLRLPGALFPQFAAVARPHTNTNAATVCLASTGRLGRPGHFPTSCQLPCSPSPCEPPVDPLTSAFAPHPRSTLHALRRATATSWRRSPACARSVHQERARQPRGGAPRCMSARARGRPHAMLLPLPQTAALVSTAPVFPTYVMRLRAAINP